MAEIGAFLSSEEHGPAALVAQAKLAEEAGIHSLFISDHFHPWIDRQGETGCGPFLSQGPAEDLLFEATDARPDSGGPTEFRPRDECHCTPDIAH
jgi:alkanesulfonate monooxygenase SsuD/methylene tetrahydromethanopterin reductase-like flavin-dependent oxidoreductase (luciferase family)